MRGVDQLDLVSKSIGTQQIQELIGLNETSDIAGDDLGSIFGIELAPTAGVTPQTKKKGVVKAKK